MNKKIIIDGVEVNYNGEKNLLELARKAGVELPTFCYHSELSVYGACRLCLIDIEGKGIVSSCSTAPEPGMIIKTNTPELREIRKIAVELLLANHKMNCPSCAKSYNCKLLEIANKVGVEEVRFKKVDKECEIDFSSHSLVRDSSKCILCGDCVRACEELQSVGAIDFAYRGSRVNVLPAFGKKLNEVECVDCGQCARVCPTGAINPKSNVNDVWKILSDERYYVVAQVAPAVRVSIGEMFEFKPGINLSGKLVAALKKIGFKKVYDTSFAADLTVLEESNEFLGRFERKENLPLLTSCCPAWVKFVEQYYPEFISSLSTCKSPQQMLGAIIKNNSSINSSAKEVKVVSIMPCVAKKSEAEREEMTTNGTKDVDLVLSVVEIASMIKQAGIDFKNLSPESFDLPFGFKSGAGVLFGKSGGVAEAVVRYLNYENNFVVCENKIDLNDEAHWKEIKFVYKGKNVKAAVISGLKNARQVLDEIKKGNLKYDFIEVMACPRGCIGGAGQPVYYDDDTLVLRRNGIIECDVESQIRNSKDNLFLMKLYMEELREIGSSISHSLLHTHYRNRKRLLGDNIEILSGGKNCKAEIKVCVGTSCFLRGSQELLMKTMKYVDEKFNNDEIKLTAEFCEETCSEGPTVTINGKKIKKCKFEDIKTELNSLK